MHTNLLTLSHEPLVWSDSLPSDFKGVRLPGGQLASAIGAFGSVCIQEFRSKHFTIRYNVLDILQELVLKNTSDQHGFHTAITLKGTAQHQVGSDVNWKLRQHQFSVLHALSPEIISVYNKNIHISFDTFISATLAKDILPFFKMFSQKIRNEPAPHLLYKPFCWAELDTIEDVYSIINCRYEMNLRRWFFKSRVRDLFFGYMVQLTGHNPGAKQPSEMEIQGAYKAEQIISENIKEHTDVTKLADRVSLNEFTFKKVFKKIFGMGPYEYLLSLRMKKAKELLEDGLSIKEVAAQTGYRSSNFSSVFINFYHFPPSAVQKGRS